MLDILVQISSQLVSLFDHTIEMATAAEHAMIPMDSNPGPFAMSSFLHSGTTLTTTEASSDSLCLHQSDASLFTAIILFKM